MGARGTSKHLSKLNEGVDDKVDTSWIPRGHIARRRSTMHRDDPDCGYSFEHNMVFVQHVMYGDREYECINCGVREVRSKYEFNACDPDIHEMLEVGALELAWIPRPTKSRDTVAAIRRDMETFEERRTRRQRKSLDEMERSA